MKANSTWLDLIVYLEAYFVNGNNIGSNPQR